MASHLNYGVGHTAGPKPDGAIGRAPGTPARDHSGAPTAAQEFEVAVETQPSGRVDDGARQEPSADPPAPSLEGLENLTVIEKGSEESETIAVDLLGLSLEELMTFEAIEGTSSYKWKPTTELSVDLPALSLEGLRNLTVIEKGSEESETPTEIHPTTESIAVDLPGLSLEELMTFKAIEGTSSYKWKPTTELSVDLPALSLEGLRNLTVIEKGFGESETSEEIAVNPPALPVGGGGAGFSTFDLAALGGYQSEFVSIFTPDDDFSDSGASTGALSDGQNGTTTTTITSTTSTTSPPANDPPTTNNAAASGAEDAASIAVTLTGGDVDGTVQSFALGTLAANGTLYTDAGLTTTAATATDFAATAEALTLYFVPGADFNGVTSFDFAAKDDSGASDATPATATVTVTAVNDAPAATNSLASMEYGVPVSGTLTATDTEDQPSVLSYSLSTGPANGTVTVAADGSYTYTPNAGYSGSDSFTFQVTDPGALSDTATVSIDILAKNLDTSSGSEFQVNTATVGNQSIPSTSALTDGGFVVTWTSTDADKKGVFGQRYDSGGNTVGSEFQVNTFTTGNQDRPSVTGLADGGFIVAWDSSQDGDKKGVFGQRYDSSGNTVGSEFQINTTTLDNQERPAVADLADGGFVVTWKSPDADGKGIFGQRYDSGGNTVGSEFQINTYTTGNQDRPSVTGLADGGFLVAWDSQDQDGDKKGVFGQRYDSSGNAVGSEFQINTNTVDNQERPALAELSTGGFVVVWQASNADPSKKGVFGQLYDSSGNTVGSEFQVNTFTAGNQERATVTGLADGGFLVTWASQDQDGDKKGVFGQRYDSSGNTVGSEFQINTYTTGDQKKPAVIMLEDGSVIVTWQSNGQDGDGQGIYAIQYTAVSTGPHTFTGGAGNDSFIGGSADDTLIGGAGDDSLIGGAGADSLDGGDGTDTASYIGSGAGVTVSLATGSGSGGDAQGDTLTGIENLTGSAFDDVLTGDGNANTLDGGGGDDVLSGGGGDDILAWDSLDTMIDGGTGTDTLRVDSGDADLTAFAGTITGIEVIDLATDTGANTVTLAAADVLDISDTDTVTITGDGADSVEAGSGWTDGGIAGGFHTYTQGLATLLVDTDVTVNADITA